MKKPLIAGALLVLHTGFGLWASVSYDVRDFGAKGDGVTKDTTSIQASIDTAEQRGGGVVLIPPGRFLSGTIHLKNNVTLYLAPGSTLLASPDNSDFDPYEQLPFQSVSDRETTYFNYGLVTADGAHNIAIVGQGVIDGNRTKRGGPKTIALKLCQHVTIRGIIVKNSPNYSISFWGCDYVDVDGVTVLNGYADGIDPDSSRYVRIANCFVQCWDDAICPKASPSMGMDQIRPTEHLTVTNCVLSTNCSNFKLGTESSGDFRDITFTNCTMLPRPTGRHPISGISLESVDGAHIDGVVVSNVTMRSVTVPIFIRLGNRGRGMKPPIPGSVRNVSVQNVIATDSAMTASITGIPGHLVQQVMLSGINITMQGGGTEPKGLDVPEFENKYPEGTMFGTLPAYGLFARHVQGLTLSNFHVRWAKEDLRPAMIFNDVQDADIDGFRTDTAAGALPVLWLNSVRDVLVRGSWVVAAQKFLRVSGPDSRAIKLVGNDFSNSGQAVELVNVPKSAVIEVGNVPPAHRARSRGRAIRPSQKDP